MISFEEYMARNQGGDPLGIPAEMLAKTGISPGVPHNVHVLRIVKRQKKRDAIAKADGGIARP